MTTDLPYHHDWEPEFETSLALRLKWFGRWGGEKDWAIEPSRLASHLVCFFYLEKGTCNAEVNGTQLVITPGDLVVLRGADVFSFSQNPSEPQTSLSACLSLSREGRENELVHYAYQRLYQLPDQQRYEERFADVLVALKATGRWRELHVTAALFQWLAELQEALQPTVAGAEGNPKTVGHVLDAQEWIRQRLGEDVTIAAWAAACQFNVDYFSRLFKAHTGMRPKAWLNEARLQRASRLLDSPDMTVEEVATLCGFKCPFHFSRSFKRRFGIPPSQYRTVRMMEV